MRVLTFLDYPFVKVGDIYEYCPRTKIIGKIEVTGKTDSGCVWGRVIEVYPGFENDIRKDESILVIMYYLCEVEKPS